MNPSGNDLTISEKIKRIISKFYEIEVFKADPYSFEPICIIKLEKSVSSNVIEEVNSEFREIGYQVKFHKISKYDINKYNLPVESIANYYKLGFEAKLFTKDLAKIKKSQLIQLILLIITSGTIIISAFFYIYRITPYYSNFGKSILSSTISIISFCIGMFLIIVVHEFGHIFFSRKHNLDTSFPYLIPGPPPLGMLGAFVSIKEEPNTRNQKFDIAIGGIVLGIIISLILIIIGLLLSDQVDTMTYLQARADYFGNTPAEEADFVKDNLNYFNLIFLGLRSSFFNIPAYETYYGFRLPESILIIHPLAFTGWVGLCLSALNLIPLPFLDGGYILRAIFPHPVAKFIGLIVSFIIFIYLNPYLLTISFIVSIFACFVSYMSFQAIKGKGEEEAPFPMIPLTRNRKILALSLILIFLVLFPLSYDNIFYGFGF